MKYSIRVAIIKELPKSELTLPGMVNLNSSQSIRTKEFLTNIFSEEELTVLQLKTEAKSKLGDVASFAIDREVLYIGNVAKTDDNELVSVTQRIEYNLITK
jgi:hypothetical protein